MNNHLGDAVLCLDDGRLLSVNADLSKDGSGTWGGTLFATIGAAATSDLANLTEGTLLIGNRTGAFVRRDTSDWIDSPDGEFRLCIEGNGDAPF
ncbi:hypothetical protein [Streptomyces sp. SCL15-4]|uniref:hypothetical protein n=1 Tax=Streptomyces sp. SCL15-4 TaxID=2967221 RepID=UPI002965EBD2|nr:hypothetical protein [Streptomyces sp. SCL15-4]